MTCNLLPRRPTDFSDMAPEESIQERIGREAASDWMPTDHRTYFAANQNRYDEHNHPINMNPYLSKHPCREPFSRDPMPHLPHTASDSATTDRIVRRKLDFSLVRDPTSNIDNAQWVPRDDRVCGMTRKGQIASQMHRCTFTCWKYNRYPGQRQCRFEGDKWDDPVHFHENTIIHRDTDARNRVRIRVLPPRNNTHLNNTFVSPLVTAAMSQCNRDIKMVENEYGQVEYVCSYSGKAEAADDNIFIRCLQKKFAKLEASGQLNTQEQLKAVGNSLLDAIAVQSVQV